MRTKTKHIYTIESFAKKLGSVAAKRQVKAKCLVKGNTVMVMVRGPRYYKKFTVAVGRS